VQSRLRIGTPLPARRPSGSGVVSPAAAGSARRRQLVALERLRCRSNLDPAPRAHKTPGQLNRLPQRGPAQVSRRSAARGWPVVMLVNHRSIAEGYRRVRRRPSARRTRVVGFNQGAVAAVPSAVGPAAARRGGLCAFNSASRRRIPPGGATGRPRGRTWPLSCPGGPRRAGRRHAGGR
jgi:hypothetical protein